MARKTNIGPGKSAHRLYVRFLPSFQKQREDFNYFSDDQWGVHHGKELLIRRVLFGTCKDRYRIAMLYETTTNTCLKVFTVDGRIMTYAAYQVSLKKSSSLFKLYICCRPSYVDQLLAAGKRHPIIMDSVDYDPQTGAHGKEVAMNYFWRFLTTNALRFEFEFADVYEQKGNKRVARFDHLGRVEEVSYRE